MRLLFYFSRFVVSDGTTEGCSDEYMCQVPPWLFFFISKMKFWNKIYVFFIEFLLSNGTKIIQVVLIIRSKNGSGNEFGPFYE